MKSKTRIFAIITAIIMCISFAGCGDSKAKSKAIDVLNHKKVNPSFAATIGNAIANVFFDYEIECTPCDDSDSEYNVKISGSYCPNPDIPNLSFDGSITYLVDIDEETCKLVSDPDNVYAALLVYALN